MIPFRLFPEAGRSPAQRGFQRGRSKLRAAAEIDVRRLGLRTGPGEGSARTSVAVRRSGACRRRWAHQVRVTPHASRRRRAHHPAHTATDHCSGDERSRPATANTSSHQPSPTTTCTDRMPSYWEVGREPHRRLLALARGAHGLRNLDAGRDRALPPAVWEGLLARDLLDLAPFRQPAKSPRPTASARNRTTSRPAGGVARFAPAASAATNFRSDVS